MDTHSFMPYGSQLQHGSRKHSLLEGWGRLGVDFQEGLFLQGSGPESKAPTRPGAPPGWGRRKAEEGVLLLTKVTISAILLQTIGGWGR